MFTEFHDADYSLDNKAEFLFLSILHRVTSVLIALLALYWLLMSILSYDGALQDMRKFSGLGFSYPFEYYLLTNRFPEALATFLCVTIEFLLYFTLYCRANKGKLLRGSVFYFSVMLVVHAAVWLHAHYLIPEYVFQFSYGDKFVEIDYCSFANDTIFPAVAYFVLYLFRVRKIKANK